MTGRVLIVVFDALRPEFVRADLMPALSAFAEGGVRYVNSRATYPTETRVNQSAVTTGCLPSGHGIVGNAFLARALNGTCILNTGDDTALEAAAGRGPLLCAPSLGQTLTAAGRSFATLSAGTPGGGRLINWTAEGDGSVRLAMRRPEACVPARLFDDVAARIGPLPEYALPATAWIDWAVAAYLGHIEPVHAPDCMLLWLCEPDESFHWHGIGSPEAERAVRAVDDAFARILDRHRAALERGEMHVVAMSDHGQISLRGDRLDLAAALTAAGFPASRQGLDGAEIALAVGNAGGLWLENPARAEAVVDWLVQRPWCGPVFTRERLLGTLSQAELGLDHPHAPDISVVLRAESAPNRFGLAGTTLHDAPYPDGGGCHGGLSPWELRNVLTLGGAAFRQGVEVAAPAGNIDVMPTVLTLLGVPALGPMHGRVLREAMRDGPEPASLEVTNRTILSENTRGPKIRLEVTEVGRVRYLDQAEAV